MLNLFKKKGNKDFKHKKAGTTYYDVEIKEVIRETEDAVTIVLENPDNEISYKAGQYLTLILEINGEEVRRTYSLCSSPALEDDLAVTVKKIDGGTVSRYINEELKAGDWIRIMEPQGNFTTEFDENNERTLLLFAGGSGITPLMSILKTALEVESKSKVLLIYQNRNLQSVIYHDQIQDLLKKYPDHLKVVHILSKPEKSWMGRSGRLTAEMVHEIVEEESIPLDKTDVFFCGPIGMMETAELVMDELGIEKPRQYKENFVASTREKKDKEKKNSDEDFTVSTVTILLDNETRQVKVKRNEFILENALDADIDMPFSCQSGLCTTCRGKLVKGKVKMEDPDGLSEDEIARGYILTCVSRPASKEIKIDME